jgi:hypothetical protein
MLWPLGPCSQPQPNRSPPSGRPARRATRQSRCCAWSSRVTDRTFGRLLRKSPCTAMPPSPILTLRRRHDRGMQATDRPLPARAGQDPPAGSERPRGRQAPHRPHRHQLASHPSRAPWAARQCLAWPARTSSTCCWPPSRPTSQPSPCSAGAWLPAPGPGGLSGQPAEPSQTQAFIRPPQRRPAAAIPVAVTLLGPQRTGR